MTEIVRLVGYGDMPAEQLRTRLKPLMDRFGRQKVLEAATELLEFDEHANPRVARLKAEVAKLAFQLLGPRPKASATDAVTPCKVTTATPVNMPRYHVLGKYEDHLNTS